MGIGTRDAFTANVEVFLRDHAVVVRGAWGHPARVPGDVRAAAGAPVFPPLSAQQTTVRLNAPQVGAYFEKDMAAVEPRVFPFSKPTVRVELAPLGTAKTLPVYLIPFEGGTGHGVQLPSQAQDGLPVAYAVTAAQNGCTVEVSGPPASPYASHTNVADQEMVDRQHACRQRLAQLQQDFFNAAGLGQGAPNPAAGNRYQFGHYGGTVGVAQRNYTGNARGLIGGLDGRTVKSAYRQGLGLLGHRNFRYSLTPDQAALDPVATAQAQVVAERQGGQWTFYYQIWDAVSFGIHERDKWAQYRYDGRTRRDVTVRVVLAWGQLWPHPTQNLATLS